MFFLLQDILMRQNRFRPTAFIFALFVLVLSGQAGRAADFVMTADMTKVRCENGQDFVLEPFQILEFQGNIDRGTYRVKLPTNLSKHCRVAEVKSMDVYHVGDLGEGARTQAPAPVKTQTPERPPTRSSSERLQSLSTSRDEVVDGAFSNEPRSRGSRIDNTHMIADEVEIDWDKPTPRQRRSQPQERSFTPRPTVREVPNEEPADDGSVLKSEHSANAFFKSITRRMAPLCREQFLGTNDFGPWGEHAKEAMSLGFFEDTLKKNKSAFAQICPGYRTMSVEQKKNLVVLTIMAQANYESSCNPRARNDDCPNGICAGIFQLHLGREHQYVSSKEFKQYCPQNASNSPKQSISCSLAMFMEDLWQGESIIGNRSSYWEVLAPQYAHSRVGDLRALVYKIPDCKMNPSMNREETSRSSRNSRMAQNNSSRRLRAPPSAFEFPDSPMSESEDGNL